MFRITCRHLSTGFAQDFAHLLKYLFRISDTAGLDCCCSSDARIRLANADTDVVIIAFNIMNRASFDNVMPVWYKEKKKDMPKAKVGNDEAMIKESLKKEHQFLLHLTRY